MNAQKIETTWLQDPNGRGIAFDGSGLVMRDVHLDDVTKTMLLEAFREAVCAEREACAKVIEETKMGDVLLAAGELTAGERRSVRALLPWLANKVRART